MTKERLEELRKQKATVYTVFDGDKKATPLVLDDNCNDNNVLFIAYLSLSNLYETKEQAEWHAKTVAERTERFEPPMWEDFNHYEFQFINHENGGARKIIFEVLKKQDDKAKTGGYISILNTTLLKDIYEVDTPTKENYEKACEIVRDLFKGESNGKKETK